LESFFIEYYYFLQHRKGIKVYITKIYCVFIFRFHLKFTSKNMSGTLFTRTMYRSCVTIFSIFICKYVVIRTRLSKTRTRNTIKYVNSFRIDDKFVITFGGQKKCTKELQQTFTVTHKPHIYSFVFSIRFSFFFFCCLLSLSLMFTLSVSFEQCFANVRK
jgi:hypothetical protein